MIIKSRFFETLIFFIIGLTLIIFSPNFFLLIEPDSQSYIDNSAFRKSFFPMIIDMMEKSDLEIQFHEAVASTLRAMAGGTEHEVVFVGDNTFIGNDKVRLPKINDIQSDSSRLRGEADKIALWIKYHNPELDKDHAPRGSLQKEIYESAEYAIKSEVPNSDELFTDVTIN